MGVASRIFQGTVIVGLVGTAATEFVKSATATVTTREITDVYNRTRAISSVPSPPLADPVDSAVRTPVTVGAPLPAPAAEPLIPAGLPLNEKALLGLVEIGEFRRALEGARANPELVGFVPGCALLVEFAEFQSVADYVNARRAVLAARDSSPRLVALATMWNCRMTRQQKGLPTVGACMPDLGVEPHERP